MASGDDSLVGGYESLDTKLDFESSEREVTVNNLIKIQGCKGSINVAYTEASSGDIVWKNLETNMQVNSIKSGDYFIYFPVDNRFKVDIGCYKSAGVIPDEIFVRYTTIFRKRQNTGMKIKCITITDHYVYWLSDDDKIYGPTGPSLNFEKIHDNKVQKLKLNGLNEFLNIIFTENVDLLFDRKTIYLIKIDKNEIFKILQNELFGNSIAVSCRRIDKNEILFVLCGKDDVFNREKNDDSRRYPSEKKTSKPIKLALKYYKPKGAK